jgi:hypothetical protein
MMNLRSEFKDKRWIFMFCEIRVSFQFFRIFSNFHFDSPFSLSLITFDDDYERKWEGLHEFTWTGLEIRTNKILHLFLVVLVNSTRRLKINQFLLLSLLLIQNELRLSLLLFSFCLCDRMIHHSNDEFMLGLQGTSSMMMITQVITESLLNSKPFLMNCKLLISILGNLCWFSCIWRWIDEFVMVFVRICEELV